MPKSKASAKTKLKPAGDQFEIAGERIPRGSRKLVEIPVSRTPWGNWLSLPMMVIHGRASGPTIWLSAGVHGDEINGIEIIRRLLGKIEKVPLYGTVIAVPTVNVFGVLNGTRYLPDRRDLNRSFPGSSRGSLASRVASIFTREVIKRSDFGIDFHTGSNGRTNLPHIRVSADSKEAMRLARLFSPSVIFQAKERPGSLRSAARKRGVPALLFEGGEEMRFDAASIKAGVAGALRVMKGTGMIDKAPKAANERPTLVHESIWVRAKMGGMCDMKVSLGDRVEKGSLVAEIHDAFNTEVSQIVSPAGGIVVGARRMGLANAGESLVHIAY